MTELVAMDVRDVCQRLTATGESAHGAQFAGNGPMEAGRLE